MKITDTVSEAHPLRKSITEIKTNMAARRENIHVTRVGCGGFQCVGCNRQIKETELIVTMSANSVTLCTDCLIHIWQRFVENAK